MADGDGPRSYEWVRRGCRTWPASPVICSGPANLERSHRLVESLELDRAPILEEEALAEGQVVDGSRHEDPARLGGGAEPCGQLHRRPEQVVVLGDGLAGGEPDAAVDRLRGAFGVG